MIGKCYFIKKLGIIHSFRLDGDNRFEAQTINSIIGFYHHKFCLVINLLYCSRDDVCS